eukprot:626679-Rhodomonas_salina.3
MAKRGSSHHALRRATNKSSHRWTVALLMLLMVLWAAVQEGVRGWLDLLFSLAQEQERGRGSAARHGHHSDQRREKVLVPSLSRRTGVL